MQLTHDNIQTTLRHHYGDDVLLIFVNPKLVLIKGEQRSKAATFFHDRILRGQPATILSEKFEKDEWVSISW